jgi:hydroxymethylpyrimidine/phosphomethylpyrimidine kinase
MKRALTISGSDSSGGAGIQADLKTFTVLGVFGMSAVTAVTAQNTLGIHETQELTPELVRQQIDYASGDAETDATKTGMLVNAAIVEAVEDSLKRNKLAKYVCDPVMISRSGTRLLSEDGIAAMTKKLFPLATVLTPDVDEAAKLTGSTSQQISSIPAAKESCRRIMGMGPKAVVIKSVVRADQTIDLFFDGKEFLEFAAATQPAEKSHGSGDVFSAAITAGLALGKTLIESIDQAKSVVNMAIQYSDGQGRGIAPVNVLAFAPKKK